MRVDTNTAISRYSQPKPPAKAAPVDSGPKTPVDKVSLSTTMSPEKLEELLITSIENKLTQNGKFGDLDLKSAMGTDVSPEATSDRIVAGTTGFMDAFRAQNEDLSEAELIDKFESVIRSSVDQGAGEAMGLIAAIDTDGKLGSQASDTMSLVHAKFDDFFASLRDELGQEKPA